MTIIYDRLKAGKSLSKQQRATVETARELARLLAAGKAAAYAAKKRGQ
jgi:hypothetical protein